MRVISLMLLLGFTLVSPTFAAPRGQVSPPPRGQVSPPFSKLFRPPTAPVQPLTPVVPSGQASLNTPLFRARQPAKIVCGMTMVPVDSSLDPKIERPVPSTGTKFTLRISKPPVCGQ